MKSLRAALVLGIALAHGAIACALPPEPERGTAVAELRTGRMGSHGMILFGKERVFLSHIPMFTRPHDVQLVVEVEIGGGSVALPTFERELFTFLPARFSIDALAFGEVTELTGSVYLGNFEDGGRLLATGVRATVKRVVFHEVLDATAAVPSAPEHLVVGTETDAYAVRRIGGRATENVDEIVALKSPLATEVAAALVTRDVTAFDATDLAARAYLSCLVGPDFIASCLP